MEAHRELCERIKKCAIATQTRMIIMQGTPGSGKSTVAKMLQQMNSNAIVVSADNYFTDEVGVYRFDPSRLSEAHESCRQSAREAAAAGKTVVIDNCNATKLQVDDYLKMLSGVPCVVFMKCDTAQAAIAISKRSIHNVPEHAVRRCYAQLERLPGNYITHNVA